MVDAGSESREKAVGLLADYGALSLSRQWPQRLSDEFLQAGEKLSEQCLARERRER